MNRLALWFATILVAVCICWVFPPFRIVPLKRAAEQKDAGVFNAGQFAGKFWNGTLLASLDKAVKAGVLMPAIQRDPAAARNAHARQLGLSESYTYFVAGRGRVLGVSPDDIALAITAGATNAEIVLQTGLVFGNAVRDGPGLLSVSDFPNSQDFNDISAALNKVIESRILPILREEAKAGATVRFVGCAEVADESSDLQPLKVIPIQAEVE